MKEEKKTYKKAQAKYIQFEEKLQKKQCESEYRIFSARRTPTSHKFNIPIKTRTNKEEEDEQAG